MKINNLVSAEKFLALHIPNNSQSTFPGELGLKRAKYFLHLLGRPQEKLKIIHVAGTSGKGSTCYLISSLLISHGFKVGFHQSPHLTDVVERFQIDGKRISQEKFISYLNKIIPIIKAVGKTTYGTLSYFEILVGLAFYIFNDNKVDYAVMETGLGGKYDGTNVVSRTDKLSVLTKIGLDHTDILGKNIEAIALQKAMIINDKSHAISINQDLGVERVIREIVEKKQAQIIFVPPLSSRLSRGQRLGLIGEYQKENASLALAVVDFLSKRDGFNINQIKIKKVFEKAKFPGRFDIKKIFNRTVIFDGAHNPQKMEAFVGALIQKYPNIKFNFLLAFKKGKDYQDMLKIIASKADSIILTGFVTKNQDMINLSEKPSIVGQQLKKIGFNNFEIRPFLEEAIETVLKKKEPIVVTGSLYLVGEIYRLIKEK